LDHRISLGDAWRRVGHDRGVQGNLDAARLLAGWEATRAGARAVLDEAGGRPGHVFNLGHGGLPPTDTDLLRRLVALVHEETAQAAALGGVLGWPVEVGMRFSDPSILAGMKTLAEAGVTTVAAIILSPQYSPLLMNGYLAAIEEARAALGNPAPEVSVAGAWEN